MSYASDVKFALLDVPEGPVVSSRRPPPWPPACGPAGRRRRPVRHRRGGPRADGGPAAGHRVAGRGGRRRRAGDAAVTLPGDRARCSSPASPPWTCCAGCWPPADVPANAIRSLTSLFRCERRQIGYGQRVAVPGSGSATQVRPGAAPAGLRRPDTGWGPPATACASWPRTSWLPVKIQVAAAHGLGFLDRHAEGVGDVAFGVGGERHDHVLGRHLLAQGVDMGCRTGSWRSPSRSRRSRPAPSRHRWRTRC